jgi:hypothetical protein
MSAHAISAVRLDDKSGHVLRVRWARLNAFSDHYEGDVHEADVVNVIGALDAGEDVFLVFRIEGQNVRGPQVKTEPGKAGHVYLKTVDLQVGRGLKDLPRF